ncbi:hypothetical protein AX16_008935 [Volvariella volvacea WC 439]|nr:hypothetical protein AX16_008935 [Volvariella volvacea WC 439]
MIMTSTRSRILSLDEDDTHLYNHSELRIQIPIHTQNSLQLALDALLSMISTSSIMSQLKQSTQTQPQKQRGVALPSLSTSIAVSPSTQSTSTTTSSDQTERTSRPRPTPKRRYACEYDIQVTSPQAATPITAIQSPASTLQAAAVPGQATALTASVNDATSPLRRSPSSATSSSASSRSSEGEFGIGQLVLKFGGKPATQVVSPTKTSTGTSKPERMGSFRLRRRLSSS